MTILEVGGKHTFFYVKIFFVPCSHGSRPGVKEYNSSTSKCTREQFYRTGVFGGGRAEHHISLSYPLQGFIPSVWHNKDRFFQGHDDHGILSDCVPSTSG